MSQHQRPVRLTGGDELDDLVSTEPLVLVEFYTKGCGKCQSMEPILGNVARVTDATVAMVNPGDDLSLMDEFDIRSVPTLVLFRDGEPVASLADGFVPTDEVVDFVETNAGE
ncbi:thioredoxin family protein [Haloarchaeobius sp. HME9146]|uniref:thioredoxin family protein n=1 Tax=unclassified Haloarchaeobius TaxID=2614452 RepID=UPI0021C10CC1|nr:thioredoxin family protein [Haloarchaeobius sp. HME9146]MCT9095524.1 thioredoxin family protein [Haloarchaeobius sp. HME9146]